MTKTLIDLDKHETWIVKRFMADNSITSKGEALKEIVRQLGKMLKYRRA
ncbi:MAG: hypothetical protein AB1529_08170 [Candidatus Micrarchaeota archaeon]